MVGGGSNGEGGGGVVRVLLVWLAWCGNGGDDKMMRWRRSLVW